MVKGCRVSRKIAFLGCFSGGRGRISTPGAIENALERETRVLECAASLLARCDTQPTDRPGVESSLFSLGENTHAYLFGMHARIKGGGDVFWATRSPGKMRIQLRAVFSPFRRRDPAAERVENVFIE